LGEYGSANEHTGRNCGGLPLLKSGLTSDPRLLIRRKQTAARYQTNTPTPTPHTDSPDRELTHHGAALTIGERRKPAYS
jgi:hypothetical protein